MKTKIIKIKKDADDILEQSKGIYESMFVVGWDKNGNMKTTYDGNLSNEQILWLIENFKFSLLEGKNDE